MEEAKQEDKKVLYYGLFENKKGGYLKVKYYSSRKSSWIEEQVSFRGKGKNCAARAVRDLSKKVAKGNQNISSVEVLDELGGSDYFKNALERSYAYYKEEVAGGFV